MTLSKIFSYLFFICCIWVLFSCSKDYSVESGNVSVASGSLWDSTTDACMPETVHGTFYNGITPGKDTAYVEIQVNVTQSGSYNISSDLQNGFQFLDSGFFTNTGLNIVRLKPIGTPIIPVPTTFNISFDTTFCSFTINVQDSTGTGLGGQDTTGNGNPGAGNWQFTQGSFTYSGIFDSAKKDNSTGLATFLNLGGSTSTGDTSLSLQFVIPAPDIQPGTYTTAANGIVFSVVDVPTLTVLYSADGFTAGTDITINVTSYDNVTKIMQGTFSGNVQDNLGNIVPLANGSFTATVQ